MSNTEFERLQELNKVKASIRTTVESDAYTKVAQVIAKSTSPTSSGRIKLSRKELTELFVDCWVAAEISAAERVLRCIELDDDLKTREDIQGELHTYLADLSRILVKRGMFKDKVTIDDLVPGGRLSTNSERYLSHVKEEKHDLFK